MARKELNIELSPELLLQQSQEMSSLKSEYEAVFQNTISDLQGINSGWSEFLSNNFSVKIQSAQKSFAGVETMLQNGAYAAKLAANNLGTLDSTLSRFIYGNNTNEVVMEASSSLGSALKTGKNIVDRLTFNDDLGTKEDLLSLKLTGKTFKDVVSIPATVAKLGIDFNKGDYASVVADTYQLINHTADFGQHGGALFELGIGRGISLMTGDDSYREAAFEGAQESYENSGFSDYLKNVVEAPEAYVVAAEAMDTYSDVVGIAKAGSSFVDDVGEAEKILGSSVLSNETKMGYVKDVVLSELGFSNTDYSNDTVKGMLNNEKGFFGNLGNIYDWVHGVSEGEVLETVVGKTSIPGFMHDIKSTIEEASAIVTGDSNNYDENENSIAQILADIAYSSSVWKV